MFIENRIKYWRVRNEQIRGHKDLKTKRLAKNQKVFPKNWVRYNFTERWKKIQKKKGHSFSNEKRLFTEELITERNYLFMKLKQFKIERTGKHKKRKVQANKSIRWMPWHREPTKDVTSCEKPRGAANKLRSADIRMRKLPWWRTMERILNT